MVAFVVAALVLIVMPGPDQALITRNALAGGRPGGLVTMLGGVLGVGVHATGAAVGVSALLVASPRGFETVKVAGAAYLLWLGVQTLRAAVRSRRAVVSEQQAEPAARTTAYLRQGFLSNALNPKVALFFVTFLPQFLSTGAELSVRAQALVLSATFAVMYVGWFGSYALVVERFGRWLRKPAVRAWVERVTGVFLIVVAVRLAVG